LSINKDLTKGSISRQIISLSVPIIGTSFIQMAYNMIDMAWLGRVGSDTVAAVGAATFYTWMGISIMLITRTGAEVGVSQSMGSKNLKKANLFSSNAITLSIILALAYGTLTYFFAPDFINFFKIDNANVNNTAISYLRIISVGAVFYYINPTFSGIYNGAGNSRLPFQISVIGLILNIIIDPILIFGAGPIPKMGAAGAAIATVFSQAIVLSLFIYTIKKGKSPTKSRTILSSINPHISLRILKFGLPVALHYLMFALFAMVLTRIIAKWGALPISIQSVGAQIEALSWMTAGGFATALSAYTGQNYGADKWDRIRKGFYTTIIISGTIGVVVTILFVGFGRHVFSLFIPEADAIEMGARYLMILGLSQFFMCVEITTAGVFNGTGRTSPPSIVGITLTGARIPLALILSDENVLGMEGVWWSITISSIIKGVVLFSWFHFAGIKKTSEKSSVRFYRLLPTRIRQQLIDFKEGNGNKVI
jgi:putative MATE family efflux protein